MNKAIARAIEDCESCVRSLSSEVENGDWEAATQTCLTLLHARNELHETLMTAWEAKSTAEIHEIKSSDNRARAESMKRELA